MTFTYCAEAIDLTDAEILSLVRGLCRSVGNPGTFGDISFLRLTAVCDLGAGHSSMHASLQAQGGPDGYSAITWFRWRGQLRDITRSDDCDCPEPGDEGRVPCLLFKGHPGPHCCLTEDDPSPSWCGS